MADIFGRDPSDYQHMQALRTAGLLEDQQRAATLVTGLPPHDFGAMMPGHPIARSGGGLITRAETTAQAVGYVTNNLQAIQSMIEEVLYTGFRLSEFIPLATDVPEGAKTYAYRVVDRAGLGRFIDVEGTTAPSAQAAQRLVPYALHYGGIVPKWSIEDVRAAMLGGIALDTETVTAGAEGAMHHIDQVGLVGDTARSLQGLTNLTTGTGNVQTAAATKTFAASTADEIRAVLINQMSLVISSTQEVFGRQIRSGMTIYLPTTQFNTVTSMLIGDNRDKTIWSSIMGQNPWYQFTGKDPMIRSVLELDADNNDSFTEDRMVTAVNDRRVMELAVPIYPRVLSTYDTGYEICAPIEYKISGLNVKRPTTIRYLTNV